LDHQRKIDLTQEEAFGDIDIQLIYKNKSKEEN